jgi:DNA helicase-2/ATP-dependent DNA helicase PcrA
MDAEHILKDLNPAQREAVLHRDGPLLVLAGPGSGKTRVITRRCAQLVHSGVSARHILAITFTNKAAQEMRRRIDALGFGQHMWMYTFHALGARLLRELGPIARVRAGFSIYDDADRKRTIKDAMEACEISPTVMRAETILNRISAAKDRLQTPSDLGQQADFFDKRQIAKVYAAYEQLMQERNAVDFDDLLMRLAIVLRDNPDVTERMNQRFQYVLIDEYQDTNHAQYMIAQLLARHHGNICATGDPDQSIYGWRGADISNILEFERDYPDARVIRLEQNYRSTGRVLKTASELIRCNHRRKHKDLWTERSEGAPVEVWKFAEGRDEAERIADTIQAMRQEGREWSDFAICYRVNAISRGLEESLRHRAIPYKIARGVEFYNRKEIKDTLAYLHILTNPDDALALLRIINTPARGIGKTTIDRVREGAQRQRIPLLQMIRRVHELPAIKKGTAGKLRRFIELIDRLGALTSDSVASAVRTVLDMSGLQQMYRAEDFDGEEDRLANLDELVTAAARYEADEPEPSLEGFLQRVSLVSDQDAIDESAGVVLLMTLHAAKGLEFPVVFIAGLEQGMLPHERSINEGDVEEERRLLFVGITRAMQRLVLTHADERYMRGEMTARVASEFLRELPDEAVVSRRFGEALGRRTQRPDAWERDDGHISFESKTNRLGRTRRRAPRPDEEPTFSPDDPTGYVAPAPPGSRFAGWAPGTRVTHEHFGVGQVVWIRPSSGQTRAAIHFSQYGQKTFILDAAPIRLVAAD